MYFRCVFLLLAVAVVRSAFPQNIRRITHRDGLSNSSILSLAQDADGYIWAGSCDGLNLWDGNSARHFRLSGNLIQEIVATDDGYLWVRTNYGVDRFDTRDRRIEMLAGFQRVYKFAARSRDEAFFLHGNKLYGYVASQGAFEPVDVRGAELNGVLRMCLDGDGVLWLVRSEDIRCAQVVYDAGGRASVGEWERMPLPDGVVFTRYDGDRTIFFTDRNGMLFRFDTGQRRAFPIFDLREELGRCGALSSVISDKDDYVLAFGMSGVLRLRSTDPIEGRYELQEIDVNCGVFALLKDCNQDIVWIGTDGSGLLRQAVGEVAIRSVTYETLPYLLTKPIKGAPCRPGGRPLDRDQERRHPAHPRFLRLRDLHPEKYAQLYHCKLGTPAQCRLCFRPQQPERAVDRHRRRHQLLFVCRRTDRPADRPEPTTIRACALRRCRRRSVGGDGRKRRLPAPHCGVKGDPARRGAPDR